jgi:hypothetical protein
MEESRFATGLSKEPAARLPYLALKRDKSGAAKQRGREAAPRVPSKTNARSAYLGVHLAS